MVVGARPTLIPFTLTSVPGGNDSTRTVTRLPAIAETDGTYGPLARVQPDQAFMARMPKQANEQAQCRNCIWERYQTV